MKTRWGKRSTFNVQLSTLILLLLTVMTLSAQQPITKPQAVIDAEKAVRDSFQEKFGQEPSLLERGMVHYAAGEIVKGKTNWEWIDRHGWYEVVFH